MCAHKASAALCCALKPITQEEMVLQDHLKENWARSNKTVLMQLKEHSLEASIALELHEVSGKIQIYSKLCRYRIREIEVETQGTGGISLSVIQN